MAGSGLESIREVEAILTGSAQLPDRGAGFFASNPPLGTATSPVQGVIADWGGAVFNVKSPQNPSGAALGDGVAVDTTAVQGAINAAIALASGDATAGGAVYLPPGTFQVGNLTYGGGNFVLFGAGMHASLLRHTVAGTCIAPSGSAFPYSDVLFDEFGIEGFGNGGNTGGIQLKGSSRSTIRRVWFDGCRGNMVQVIGGTVQGDAMYCSVEDSHFNYPNAAVVGIDVQAAASGGSHPDGLRIINNWFNGGALTTAIKGDVVGIGGGWLGADNVVVAFNNIQGCGTAFDFNGQNWLWIGNRFEVTSGTQTYTIQAGPANFPSQSNTFMANTYATVGVANFLWTDSGAGTVHIADGNFGTTQKIQTPVFSASPTIDAANVSLYAPAVMTAAVNVPNPSNGRPGQRVRMWWTQDGVGGRALAYAGANIKSVGIAAQVTTANTVTIDEMETVDGTTWRVSRLVTGQTV